MPNNALQRTRAALPLQSARGETRAFRAGRRAALSRKPLGALRVLLVMVAVAASGCASRGHQVPASISGLVVDARGVPLPGAVVAIAAERDGVIRDVTGSHDGEYAFRNLPAGRYRMMVNLPGFKSPAPVLVAVEAGSDQRLEVTVMRPEAPLVPLTSDALCDAQGAVIRELIKLARGAPAYYSLAVMDGTEYQSPSTALLDRLSSLTKAPIKPWPQHLDAQTLSTFSSREAVQVVVMAHPEAETPSLLFLSGSITEYGRSVRFRFRLEAPHGFWTVTDMVNTGTIDSGPL